MENVSEIRHHISAVGETRKITNAMEMVSSAKMRKFAGYIPYNQVYFEKLQSTMKDILMSSQNISHPYLDTHRGHRRAYIVIAGDKGMAGSYNDEILQFAYQQIQRYPGSHIATVGVIADHFFRKKAEETNSIALVIFRVSPTPLKWCRISLTISILSTRTRWRRLRWRQSASACRWGSGAWRCRWCA